MNESARPELQIELTLDELREVARFTTTCARSCLELFEARVPDDSRPREAVDAAELFAGGAPRSRLQRTTAFAAHRASRAAMDPIAQHAARSAGDAAASAYLHPLAQATQVGHILGSAINAARAFELQAGGDLTIGAEWLARLEGDATATVRDVLARYPQPPHGSTRMHDLARELDAIMRSV